MPDPNLEQLLAAASALRPLLSELVFVGGCVTGLLITDDVSGNPRGTLDVDAIAEINSYAQYAEFGQRLRILGFHEDTSEGAPLCRWIHGRTVLDVMPVDERILGFSNRWYKATMETAVTRHLASDIEIRLAAAPHFLATKIEAFKGRGRRDFLASRDLEDVISVINGREALLDEVRRTEANLREYIRCEIATLLNNRSFRDALPGLLFPDAASQSRLSIVLARLRTLAANVTT